MDGSSRYMDGFQWTLRGKGSCLNFYFPTWTLDTVPKFLAAMATVVLLGIFTEWIARLRHDVSRYHRRAAATASRSRRGAGRVWYLQAALHGLNALTAYVLMLATMTYSLELLLCVISGLVAGYWAFGGDSYTHAGSPCCAFLDEDGDDDTVVGTGFLTAYFVGGGGADDDDDENDGTMHGNSDDPDGTAAASGTQRGGAGADDLNYVPTVTAGGDSCCASRVRGESDKKTTERDAAA